MNELLRYLEARKPGPISDTETLEDLLSACWAEFEGWNQGGMMPYKLHGRMENVSWDPPRLCFDIERHGATALGSTTAELQPWAVDVQRKTASVGLSGKRLVKARQTAFHAAPVAEEIVEKISVRRDDERVKWREDGSVQVMSGKILPEGSAVKQTLQNRRKRLAQEIEKRLEELGWRKLRTNVFAPPRT